MILSYLLSSLKHSYVINGTNGKTTVTNLVCNMLKAGGLKVLKEVMLGAQHSISYLSRYQISTFWNCRVFNLKLLTKANCGGIN